MTAYTEISDGVFKLILVLLLAGFFLTLVWGLRDSFRK